jgi:diguanylate cyclase (GGDEF)-like protein
MIKWLGASVLGEDISSSAGRALVEERYFALRRQVPVIYLLAVVNLAGLQISTSERLVIGFNLPTLLISLAIVRSTQWLRAHDRIPHELMQHRMRQTSWLATVLCVAVCVWCFHLLDTAKDNTHMAVVLFGGLTAIGVAYGLSALPRAACIPLVVLALPLAGVSFLSSNPQFVGASLSLGVVALLILRLLAVHNGQFEALVRSRSVIINERRQTEQARQKATSAAKTDFLTGLPNRRAFVEALDAAVEGSDNSCAFAVAVIDLDHFKVFNDSFGHGFGDEVLETVAGRLLWAADSGALVARLGGDEFGLLIRGASNQRVAQLHARRVLSELNQPATIDGREIMIRASCGLAMSREGSENMPSRLMADADIALYRAKSQLDLPLAIFEPAMEAPHRRRAAIEHALQTPGVLECIGLVYQPIVDLRTGKIVAFEALARWHDAELGQVPPSEFVPIAEQLNLIGSISERLLSDALIQASGWPNTVRLSYNLSAVQVSFRGLADRVLAALSATGIRPDRLQVEVTETALLKNFDQARSNLTQLRSAGITIVLDDFGAGYASIGYLREIQFDQVKVDGALVTAAVTNPNSERLLAAVIQLCHSLGMETTAEHIENEQQRSLLLKLGCRLGQGFWLQPPSSAEDAKEQARHVGIGTSACQSKYHQSAA